MNKIEKLKNLFPLFKIISLFLNNTYFEYLQNI
jgi:hypothetical protein